MKIGNWIIAKENVLQKALTRTALSIASQINTVSWRGASYAPYDLTRSFQTAFEQNAIFFSVLDKIAEKFAHIPRYVLSTEAKKQRIDGDLQRLLNRPNDYQGGDQFFYLVGISYKATGEAFIVKIRGVRGNVIELYVVPPWCMIPVSDGTPYGISHFILRVDGQKDVIIAKEDVIYWKKPRLALDGNNDHLRGFSILLPAKKILAQEDSITDASVSMYQQGGAKGVLYNKTLDNLTTEQQDSIKAVVDRKINNADVKGSVATIQGEWGYLDVGMSSVDMELLKAEEAVIKKIMFVLGYPYEMYGGDATHANREQSMNYLLTQTIAPMVASLDDEMNRSLLNDFKVNSGRITSDMSELPEMQAMRLKTAIAIQTMDYISPNEKRELGGWEARPEEEMGKIWVKTGTVPIDEAVIGEPADNDDDNLEEYE